MEYRTATSRAPTGLPCDRCAAPIGAAVIFALALGGCSRSALPSEIADIAGLYGADLDGAVDLEAPGDLQVQPSCGAGLLAGSPWPMDGRCASRRAQSNHRGPSIARVKWSFPTNGLMWSSPVVGDEGTVYLGAENRVVYAIDGASGGVHWTYRAGGAVLGTGALTATGLLVIAGERSLDAIDLRTGTSVWSARPALRFGPPAIGADGTIYAAAAEGVGAFDGTSGAQRWLFSPKGEVSAGPALGAGQTVYVGCDDGHLYALDGASGAVRWSFATGDMVRSAPVIGDNGWVYFGGGWYTSRWVYALDGLTGSQRWAKELGGTIPWSPALGSDGTLYIGASDGNLYALDAASGATRWTVSLAPPPYNPGAPAVGADGTVYVDSADGVLHALDGKSGAKRWSLTTGILNSMPALGADGTLFVASRDGTVYAVSDH